MQEYYYCTTYATLSYKAKHKTQCKMYMFAYIHHSQSGADPEFDKRGLINKKKSQILIVLDVKYKFKCYKKKFRGCLYICKKIIILLN